MKSPFFKRLLFVLFLGLPGMVSTLCGFLVFVATTVELLWGFDVSWHEGWLRLALAGATGCIGFLMFQAARILTGCFPLPHDMNRLPARLGRQIAALLSGALAVGSSLGSIGLMIGDELNWIGPSVGLASILVLIWAADLKRAYRALPGFR